MDTGVRGPARAGAAVVALCLVQFVDVLGVTVVMAALPRMLRDLGAPAGAGGLVATGYAMCFGGLLMLGARLGDRYGHRRVILASLATVAAGAVLAAVAGGALLLAAGRCVQGAGAAAAVPAALRLLTTVTPDGPERRRAVAAWSATGAAAGASGFVVGGVVTGLAGWRPIFWAYLPLMAVIAVLVLRSTPPDRPGSGPRLNVAGSALLTGTVMAIVVGTTLVTEPGRAAVGVAALAGAVLAGAGFVLVDRRSRAPLLPPAVRALRTLRLGAAGSFANTWSTTSTSLLVTLYLQDTLGYGPLAAAALLLPLSVSVIPASALAARVLRRRPASTVAAAGLALVAASGAVLIAAPVAAAVVAATVLAGVGLGLASVAANTLGTAVPEAYRGAASGILNTAAQLGAATGAAVLLLVAAATTGTPAVGTPAPRLAWALATLSAAAAAATFATRPRTQPPAPTAGSSNPTGSGRRDTGGVPEPSRPTRLRDRP